MNPEGRRAEEVVSTKLSTLLESIHSRRVFLFRVPPFSSSFQVLHIQYRSAEADIPTHLLLLPLSQRHWHVGKARGQPITNQNGRAKLSELELELELEWRWL